MSVRNCLRNVFMFAMLLTLVGCGNQTAVTENVMEKEKITLWSYYETDAQKNSLNQLIEDYNTSQQTFYAEWQYVPMTEFTKRLAIGVTEEELPDIVIIDNPDMSIYVNLGLFEDITSYVKEWDDLDEYYPEVLKTVMMEERYFGVPFCCNNLALIYNKDYLEDANVMPPENWEEFIMLSKKLSKSQTYGFAMSAIEGEQSTFQILPWIYSQKSTQDIGDEGTIEAFNKIKELISRGYLDPNCINWSQNDVARKFILKEAAMMENGPWILPMLKESGIRYGIVELPFGENNHAIVGGENLGVIKGKNVQGAISFLEYYRQDEVMSLICQKSNVLPPKRELARAMALENQDLQIFVKQMDAAIARSSILGWDQLMKEIPKSLYGVITSEQTPEKAAENLWEISTQVTSKKVY